MTNTLRLALVCALCTILGIVIGFILVATFWDRLVSAINDDHVGNWLGFTGSVLGALATVIAGGLAYLGVIYSHSANTRDEAIRRLTGYLATIRELYASWMDLKATPATDPDRPMKIHSLQTDLQRPNITMALYDSILQEDQVPIFVFFNTLKVGLTNGHPHQQNAEGVAPLIFDDVTRALTVRKRLLEEGRPVSEIRGTKFLQPAPYLKALSTGDTTELAAHKAWMREPPPDPVSPTVAAA